MALAVAERRRKRLGRFRVLVVAALAVFVVASASRANAAVVTEYALPDGSLPNFIVLGPDGNMWFAEYGRDKIGQITPSGVITEFDTFTPGCGPVGVTVGYDAYVWYTCINLPRIGKVIATPFVVDYAVPVTPAGPIVSGPDGQLWYSDANGDVGLFDIVANAQSGLLVNAGGGSFYGLTSGADGNVWILDRPQNAIRKTTHSSDGFHSLSNSLTTPAASPYLPTWCLGGVWVTDTAANKLAFFTPDVGPLFETQLPTPNGMPEGIACGPDSSIWYTAPGANKLGRRHDGIEEFDVPTPNAIPYGIAIGADGSVWFTENVAGKIGRIQFTSAPPPVVPPNRTTSRCEDAVLRNAAKLESALAKCHAADADAAFKQKSHDEAACEAAARAKYDHANAKLFAKGD